MGVVDIGGSSSKIYFRLAYPFRWARGLCKVKENCLKKKKKTIKINQNPFHRTVGTETRTVTVEALKFSGFQLLSSLPVLYLSDSENCLERSCTQTLAELLGFALFCFP